MKYFFCILLFFSLNLSAQDYLKEIEYIEDFEALESLPLSNKYSNVSSVKVIYDTKNDEIYFTNSKYFKFHFDFCVELLDFKEGLTFFNENNYRNTESRRFYLATVNHYKDADIFTFEYSTFETLFDENIEFYLKVKELMYLKDDLKFFPTEANQIEFVKNMPTKIDFVTANHIYKKQKYQALNITYSFGKLHFIDIDTFDTKYVDKDDIIVINGTPIDIPFCRGIITTDFQPPLSHIVLLSHNRRTPIMALKNAFENEQLLKFKDKKVKFSVGNSNFYIQKATDRQLENYKSSRDRKRTKKLDVDFETKGLKSINSLSKNSVKYVGGKAANFGELNKIYFNSSEKLQIPKGAFAIPFYYYNQHIKKNGIDTLINNLLEEKSLNKDFSNLEKSLKEIRKRIKKSKINEFLLKEINTIAIRNGIDTLRFRSSTNAEDINGFNGAGLYDSKSGILNNEKKTYEKAIKKVWASLWNLRAYQEREFFKIDQKTIAMGILVHESFPDEDANGVAITKNIYRPERSGFVVNIQKGDVSVVLPPEGITSEQLIIKHNIEAKDLIEIDYISYSSLNNNKPILNIEELVELNRILAVIKLHFFSEANKITRPNYDDFAMDVEFKIEKTTRKIIVKQARIY